MTVETKLPAFFLEKAELECDFLKEPTESQFQMKCTHMAKVGTGEGSQKRWPLPPARMEGWKSGECSVAMTAARKPKRTEWSGLCHATLSVSLWSQLQSRVPSHKEGNDNWQPAPLFTTLWPLFPSIFFSCQYFFPNNPLLFLTPEHSVGPVVYTDVHRSRDQTQAWTHVHCWLHLQFSLLVWPVFISLNFKNKKNILGALNLDLILQL